MVLANKYVYSLESYYLPNIDVMYPDNDEGTCYKSSRNKIYIENYDEFDWDVCQHEYGHYVADQFDIDRSSGGNHSYWYNVADAYMMDDDSDNDDSAKDLATELAWSEGWATYFAINLQKIMSANLLYIPNVGDSLYQDKCINYTASYDLEYLASSYWLGEANEATVSAVLYDMTDGYDSTEDDNIYISNSDIWNIIKNNHCQTLSEFVYAFYSFGYSPYTKYSLGSTLSRYKVAANLNNVTIPLNDSPTFSWIAQGGSSYFPNNRFELVILDNNYNFICSSGILYYASNYHISSTTWNNIKNNYSTIHYYVTAKQTDQTVTGPYYSTLKTAYLN